MSGPAQLAAQLWLANRQTMPPLELDRRLRSAIERTGRAESVPALLVEAALENLAGALALGDQRSGADALLAADALLTYACEAAAEQGVAELQTLVDQLDLHFFESRLIGPA